MEVGQIIPIGGGGFGIKPNIEEVEFNPRSRSAKLRIAQRIN